MRESAAAASPVAEQPRLHGALAGAGATAGELDALARGLRNEALQLRRAKELAAFSMEPDTHASALRAQSPEVTSAQAAELVGLPADRYRQLRTVVERTLGPTAAVVPSSSPSTDDASRVVEQAWAEYRVAAVADAPLH